MVRLMYIFRLILIVSILIVCFKSFGQVWTDSITFDSFRIEHDSKWLNASEKGLIADVDNQAEYIRYVFRGQRIDVYTFVDSHHGRYRVSVDDFIDTIDCYSPTRELKKTFSIDSLSYTNHRVSIIPLDYDKTFIFNAFVKYVDSSPYPPVDEPDCKNDTIYIETEIIKWRVDTVYLQPKYYILADSVQYEIK